MFGILLDIIFTASISPIRDFLKETSLFVICVTCAHGYHGETCCLHIQHWYEKI